MARTKHTTFGAHGFKPAEKQPKTQVPPKQSGCSASLQQSIAKLKNSQQNENLSGGKSKRGQAGQAPNNRPETRNHTAAKTSPQANLKAQNKKQDQKQRGKKDKTSADKKQGNKKLASSSSKNATGQEILGKRKATTRNYKEQSSVSSSQESLGAEESDRINTKSKKPQLKKREQKENSKATKSKSGSDGTPSYTPKNKSDTPVEGRKLNYLSYRNVITSFNGVKKPRFVTSPTKEQIDIIRRAASLLTTSDLSKILHDPAVARCLQDVRPNLRLLTIQRALKIQTFGTFFENNPVNYVKFCVDIDEALWQREQNGYPDQQTKNIDASQKIKFRKEFEQYVKKNLFLTSEDKEEFRNFLYPTPENNTVEQVPIPGTPGSGQKPSPAPVMSKSVSPRSNYSPQNEDVVEEVFTKSKLEEKDLADEQEQERKRGAPGNNQGSPNYEYKMKFYDCMTGKTEERTINTYQHQVTMFDVQTIPADTRQSQYEASDWEATPPEKDKSDKDDKRARKKKIKKKGKTLHVIGDTRVKLN